MFPSRTTYSSTTYSSTSFTSGWETKAELSTTAMAENNALFNSTQDHPHRRMWHLIDAVFKPPETCNTDLHKQVLNQAVADVRDISDRIKALDDKDTLISKRWRIKQKDELKNQLAKALTQVYKIMGNIPLPLMNSPNLAKQQIQLVHSSLVAEEKRYDIFPMMRARFKGDESQLERPEGGNRFLTQVAFLGYLESIDGAKVVERLGEEMAFEERRIFEKTIHYLTEQLAPQYIDLLSQIEVEKYLGHTGVIGKKDNEYYYDLERKFRNLVASRINGEESCIFPFGWALPGQQVGHHMLLWNDKESSSDWKMKIRYIDTTLIEENGTLSKTHTVSQVLRESEPVEQRNSNASDLSIKRCSIGFSNVDCSDAIDRITRILMLQIPEFASKSIEKCKEDPRMFLLKINYSLGAQAQQQIDEETPLSSWKWYDSPSCALASFQPLLQEIAKKILRQENIINPVLEQRLRGYFELLMQSYKASVVNKFLREPQFDRNSKEMALKGAYNRALLKEASETIHQEKLFVEPRVDDLLITEKIFSS